MIAACQPLSAPDASGAGHVISSPQPSADDVLFTSASGAAVEADAFETFISEEIARLDMQGLSLALIDDGEIVFHTARGTANVDTGEGVSDASIFEAASLSKPVFAYFALKMVDQGIIELDRPLHEYLPMEEFEADRRYEQVTARMVLSHTTGFPNWRWFDPAPEDMNLPRGTMYMKNDPGVFGYSGEGYNYLAKVIAHETGHDLTTLDQLFQDVVADPLGMTHSAFVQTDYIARHKVMGHVDGKTTDFGWPRSFPDDTPQTFGAAGRLHTDAVDYARFIIALINEEGLSPALFDEMFAAQSQVPLDSEMHDVTGDTAWGLGLAIEPTPFGLRYEHGGNNNNFQAGMMVFRERGLGYVFMTNGNKGQAFDDALQHFVTLGEKPRADE
ncbi:serine hydrolase [Henriciella sp.]|jgi:CubicO group peptidase (beta-lactamase class C family)|uniref:serine hydrolase domain-containing protein n=1 Tax=Henriciella sp. TaxID=1968823 RepID=UPI0025BD4120|nr:serine hydrolase domain-containing protein [Henriciella sp.]|tara:strand:- start:474 stop:1634 length:1161 start_codon:yes stop_codon:yes gene_type:complete